jgi:hypothetical protein
MQVGGEVEELPIPELNVKHGQDVYAATARFLLDLGHDVVFPSILFGRGQALAGDQG